MSASTLTSSPSPAASPQALSLHHLHHSPSFPTFRPPQQHHHQQPYPNQQHSRQHHHLRRTASSAARSPSTSPSFAPRHSHRQSPRAATTTTSSSTSSSSSATSQTFHPTSPRLPNAPIAILQHDTHRPPRRRIAQQPAELLGDTVLYVDAGTQYSPDGFPPTAGRNVATVAERPPGATATPRKRKEAAVSDESSDAMSASASSASSGHRPARLHHGPTSNATPVDKSARSAETLADPNTISSSALVTPASASASASSQPEIQEARSTHGHSAAPKRSRPDPGSQKIMPIQYETCSPKDIGVLIANMLMELIRINDQIPLRDGRLTRFHSRAPPGISVSDYLQRLIQHATLSPPILLSMVYYIDRLCTLYPAFTINSLTVHRFLITAATVAAKGLSDSFWTNPTYARIGGIPVSELATLELEFLQRVHWKIVPKPEVLEEYYNSLVERTDGYVLQESDSSAASAAGSNSDDDDTLAKSGDEG